VESSLQIARRRHADDVIAGVDEVDLAGHARRHIGQQVEGRAAEVIELDILFKGCAPCSFEDHAGIADGRAASVRMDPPRSR